MKTIADFTGTAPNRRPRLSYWTPAGFCNGGTILAIHEDTVDFVPDGGEYRELTFPLQDVQFIGAQETPCGA